MAGDTLTLSSNDANEIGVYDVFVTVSLLNFPEVLPLTTSFKATINCDIQTITLTSPPFNSVTMRIFADPPIEQSLQVVAFPACPIEIISPASFLIYSNGKLTVKPGSLDQEGEHTLNMLVRPVSPSIGVEANFPIKVNLINLCKYASF
jgi:hypothetical protein